MSIVYCGSSVVITMDRKSEYGFESPSSASKLWQISLPYFAGVLRSRPYDAVGPLYVVCMLEELKYPTQGINV